MMIKRLSVILVLCASVTAMILSCSEDDDPSLEELRRDKLAYLEDSLRISDSLKRINAAGVVNYSISVVSGSRSAVFKTGRSSDAQTSVDGAIVTISQFGKTQKDTTDGTGMVVFNGYFRSAANVTIQREGFTTMHYVVAVNTKDATQNNTINFSGNIVPIFELTGTHTATISGRITFQSDLTNQRRENVPNGSYITASIDASNKTLFSDKFLTTGLKITGVTGIYVGQILEATYSTGIIANTTNGDYSITVPAAIDGLPITLQYAEFAADQTFFQAANSTSIVQRAIYSPTIGPSFIPAGAGNIPAAAESFTAMKASPIIARSGIRIVNDVYYGTGMRPQN